MNREPMLKLIKFLNERGTQANVAALDAPQKDFASLMEGFKSILEHEILVTASINSIITDYLQRE